MKKSIIRTVLIFFAAIAIQFSSYSQFGEIGNLLSGGLTDAELMLTEYVRPVTNGLGANLTSAWYNTADVHKLGGFHINFTASVAFAPKDNQTFNLDDLSLSDNIRYDDPVTKTAAGTRGAGSEVWYVVNVPPPINQEREVVRYDLPGGAGTNMLPSPMINAGVGLIKGTEIMGRYMPTIKYGKDKTNSIDLWGIGIKHDLKQWIPFIKRVPVLQMSVMYGYTKLKFHSALKAVTPEMLGVLPANDLTTAADWDSQDLDIQFQGHTANLLFGVNLPVVCFYGGAGIGISKANLNLNGDFPVPAMVTQVSDPYFGQVVVRDADVVTDPFDIEIKNQDGGTTKPRFNAGMRFKFTVITLHFDYTYANYSVATAGLGISFR
ncbi:MAG: hypothetical protein AMS27_17390 [Bacteroides sp. SM23_62_1]|nr:MAG: hypothetical protein AMS27_17390 [Bacteroides sp. SM23_62_1]